MLVAQPTEVFTGASPVQATGDVTATRSVEAPGTRKLATQPVEAPGARTDVHSQLTSTSSGDASAVDRSLTSKRTVAADNTGVSDSEDELNHEPLMWSVTGKYCQTWSLT